MYVCVFLFQLSTFTFFSMGWLFALVVFFLQVIQVAATNYTIDDQNGNSLTGELPSYAPSNRWSQGAQCSACFAQPDSEFTFDHSQWFPESRTV